MENCAAAGSKSPANADGVWKLFSEFSIYERHFNELQSRYRSLASGWLLAIFGAVGFVLTKNLPPDILSDRFLVLALIGLGGALGIILLWNLDLRVYHELLLAVFDQGRKLEKQYPWVPPVRQEMQKHTRDRGVMRQVSLFYGAADFVLLGMSGWSLWRWHEKYRGQVSTEFLILLLTLLALLGLSAYLWWSISSRESRH